MHKIFRILGKKGRITIPYEIRQRLKIGSNDILSFSLTDENAVVIRHERICDNCRNISFEDKEYRNISIKKFIDDLSEEEQRDALVHLSVKWAEKESVSAGKSAENSLTSGRESGAGSACRAANQGGEFNA